MNGTKSDHPMITLDADSHIPPYEQVRVQIAAQVVDGMLAAGTRLPSVRKLADDLDLAPNTVARAYRELETAGIVETRGRGGTVVSSAGDAARARVLAEAQRFAALANELGIGIEEAVRIVRGALGGQTTVQ